MFQLHFGELHLYNAWPAFPPTLFSSLLPCVTHPQKASTLQTTQQQQQQQQQQPQLYSPSHHPLEPQTMQPQPQPPTLLLLGRLLRP
jgi:hypothetical protein